jgi:Right handed beta helix region
LFVEGLLEKERAMKFQKHRVMLFTFLFLLSNFAQGQGWLANRVAVVSSQGAAPHIVTKPIPQPSGMIVKVSTVKNESELGKRINLADKMIGERDGSIVVDVVGAIETPLHLTSNHRLYFGAGEYSLSVPGKEAAAIMLENNNAIYGAGINKTILLEPTNGYYVIAGAGLLLDKANGVEWAGIRSNITLAGFTIRGRNTAVEGGVRSAVALGNAHDVHIYNIGLENTSALGVTAGGNGASGNHAERWLVEESFSRGSASQAWNVVNGREITFKHIIVLDMGKLCGGNPCEGATAFDVEPNVSQDAASNITITDCWIDSSNSSFLHGNGILIQNGVGVPDFGPVTVTRNHVDGGPHYRIATGIYVTGQNTTVTDNYVTRVGHSGLRLEGATGNQVERNELVSTGTGGIHAFEITNSSGNTIRSNTVRVDPQWPLGNGIMVELGKSDRNIYKGNAVGTLTVIGKQSRVE